MRKLRTGTSMHLLTFVAGCIIFGIIQPRPSFAQNMLTFLQPQTGSISIGSAEEWSFTGVAGQVISLIVTSDGSLDPVLTLSDSSGRVLLRDDDFDYPNRTDSLLQSVTLPRTGAYTATIEGFGNTSGEYTILLSNGFAEPVYQDHFDQPGSWTSLSEQAQFIVEDGVLNAAYTGSRSHAAALSGVIGLADMAVKADILNVRNPSSWTVGLITRQQGEDYYLYEVNNEGRWRFSVVEHGSPSVIRDWTSHPAIIAGDTAFSLMLMAHDIGFDLFYDDAFVGSVSDDRLTHSGDTGVTVGTISSLDSQTTAQFDNFIVTRPITIDGMPVIPQMLVLGDANTISQALIRRHVARADGSMALTVPEATVNYARSGINRLMLGQGTTYTNFALGATVNTQVPFPTEAGCGLIVRFAGSDSYLLGYLDASGGYGLSQFEGEAFLPGIFGQNLSWAGSGEHHLLIIADETRLYFYVNGISVGVLDGPAQAGEVGVAAINYEPVDTSCRFENLWLWEWDS